MKRKQEEMVWQEVPVADLHEAEWNYKTNDEFMQERLRENIKRNGQLENLIVRVREAGGYEVVNGNHRLREFKALNYGKLMVCNLGAITQAQAERVAIETNETRFASDELKLGEALKRIKLEFSTEELERTLPMTGERISDLVGMTNFSWSQFDKKPDGAADGSSTSGEEEVGTGKPPQDQSDWRTIAFRVPADVAFQWDTQLTRFKMALHPEERDMARVSPVMAVEAMLQHLAQLEDEQLIG